MGEVSYKMAGAVGIEPTLMVLETIVKPFNYTPKKSALIYYHLIRKNSSN